MTDWLSRQISRLKAVRRVARDGHFLLFLKICLFAAAVPALVRFELRRLQWLLHPRVVPTNVDARDIATLANLVSRAQQLASPVVRSGCLTRGLTLYYFLRRAVVSPSCPRL